MSDIYTIRLHNGKEYAIETGARLSRIIIPISSMDDVIEIRDDLMSDHCFDTLRFDMNGEMCGYFEDMKLVKGSLTVEPVGDNGGYLVTFAVAKKEPEEAAIDHIDTIDGIQDGAIVDLADIAAELL